MSLHILGTAASAHETQETIEIVQTAPLETTLAVKDVQHTADVWLQMFQAAHHSIDLEQFYIDNMPGAALEPIITELEKASARGVHVRILLDSKFYKTYPTEPQRLARIPSIQVRIVDYSKYSGIQHAKFFVIDHSDPDAATGYLGSANFDWRALTHIHEVGVKINDPQILQDLSTIFEMDWNMANAKTPSGTKPQKALKLSGPDHLLASPPAHTPQNTESSLTALLSALHAATSSVRIQVYEYSTQIYGHHAADTHTQAKWKELDSALRAAGQRGVHVQLLVDAVSLKSGKADLLALTKIPNITVRVVRIPEWSGGAIPYARLVHSKYMTIDHSTSWIGTENWSQGYFTQSRNVGILSQSENVAETLEQIFDRLWNSAYVSAPEPIVVDILRPVMLITKNELQ